MQKSKSIAGKILFAVFVIVFVGIIVLPFFWQFMTSIKPLSEISAIPAKWIPSKVHWDFYKNVFTKHPFGRYLLNSFIVALSTTVLSILIGASAAYALARLRFKGKKIMLMAILSISMFPTIATLSPIYLLLKNLKLLNTYAGLIIPYITFALPLSIWLLTNFFAQLPKGFEEAAAIDGCSRGKIFFTIMLPLIKPATFSVALIVFINAWNEYLYALTFMTTCLTIGNPHCIIFMDEVSEKAARELGPYVENADEFPERMNLQICRKIDTGNLDIEIWERGSGYTKASGTGSCAAAMAAYKLGFTENRININQPGGMIQIDIHKDGTIYMTGSVGYVADMSVAESFFS